MAIIKEGNYPGECLITEGAANISRDVVTLARHSQIYQSGTVLGQLTVGRRFTHLDPDAIDGSQVAVAVLYQERDATAAVDDLDARNIVVRS